MNEVRTHIEKVVESLVGDNIDEASVLKLTDNPSCKFLATSAMTVVEFHSDAGKIQ